MPLTVFKPYSRSFELLKRYWSAYGGAKALFRSPYLHFTALLLVTMYQTWSSSGWWDHVLSTVPSMLGFVIAGFAIFVAFGGEQFQRVLILSKPQGSDEPSPYMSFSAMFVHFALVQLIAFVLALLAKSFSAEPAIFFPEVLSSSVVRLFFWGIGYFIFLYGLLVAFAAALEIFRLAGLYERAVVKLAENEMKSSKDTFESTKSTDGKKSPT